MRLRMRPIVIGLLSGTRIRRACLCQRTWPALVLLLLLSATGQVMAEDDPFQANVRPTDPLTAEQQQATFHLPPGFEIQLFAAEPEIQKPMNLAFDARGRVWVTGSVEYPFAAPEDREGRDSIRILEDTDGDGRADKITTFAEGLNIPIGIYPYRNGAIAYTIPNIYYFEDVDGDDRADRRHLLYGPFDYSRDTHGMQNAFRRGFDGWLYASHGWANHSSVAGADGNRLNMRSGNTYRVRLDGSRMEHFTWGQTNPFGMTFDPLGNLYDADCHSRPITMLLRGGYYEGLGTTHDGLGYVPTVMEHLHGSTAIAGIAYYDGGSFPAEYRDSLFVGNVMTSRVHRDKVLHRGSTIQAEEQPDFLTCEDPWFRPVDLRFGPDGALYIADFYNRIIGHYEVDLNHPGRDRHRGRIWRVVYRGTDGAPESRVTLAEADAAQLIAELANPQIVVRMMATDQLTDRLGSDAVEPLKAALTATSETTRVHSLWALFRLNALTDAELQRVLQDSSRLVRTHAQKILAELPQWSSEHSQLALAGLQDDDSFVQRAAVDALAQHPQAAHFQPLLTLLARVPAEDVHLRHAVRMALRNQLAEAGLPTETEWTPSQWHEIASVATAVHRPEAAQLLVGYLQRFDVPQSTLAQQLQHIAKHLPLSEIDSVAQLAQEKAHGDLDLQLALMLSVQQGVQNRGVQPSAGVRRWAETLASQLLESVGNQTFDWGNIPLPEAANRTNPWVLSSRPSADGQTARVLSSFERGEELTGLLRSKTFSLPERLSFYVSGHLGFPDQPPIDQNLVRLKLARTGETVAQALAPRNDTAQRVEWDLKQWAGESGYLEIVDGIELSAYAWIAAGRFQPPVVRLPETAPGDLARRQIAAAEMVRTFGLQQLRPQLAQLVAAEHADPEARAAAVRTLAGFAGDPIAAAMANVLGDPGLPADLRRQATASILQPESAQAEQVLTEVMRTASSRQQRELAQQLAGSRRGAELLLKLIENGQASARLLRQQTLRQAVEASGVENARERIEQLTASLAPVQEELEQLIAERSAAFRTQQHEASTERGAAMFTKHCAGCHRIAGEGQLVGPQLDGIGNRGPERLVEDVLDPNRNIDAAFRTTLYLLDDGRIVSGLFRRQEGETIIVVDQTGKEISLSQSTIEEQVQGESTIMPDNFNSVMSPAEFADLLKYLLEQRQAAAE